MKSRLKKIKDRRRNERGVALVIAIIIVAILAVVALTALTFSSTEARIAGSDLQRTQAFYASESAMEKMTNDFSDLFRLKMNPTTDDLNNIANSPPTPLLAEGFTFQQTLAEDSQKLSELRTLQGLPSNVYPRVNIPDWTVCGFVFEHHPVQNEFDREPELFRDAGQTGKRV